MRQAWRGIAGLLAAGALTAGGSIALAGDGGGRHGGRDRRVAATTTFTMSKADGPPEGVAFDKRSGRFFVSRTGTGAIFSGTFGTKELSSFIPGGTAGRAPLATGLKVRKGLLYIAGASTGKITVVNLATRAVVATFDTGGAFVNDLDVTSDGDVFATDSQKQAIYRVPAAAVKAGGGAVQTIDVSAGIPARPGFNLNGIVARRDGAELIVVQSNTGKLFRITFRGRDDRSARAPTAAPRIEEIRVQGGPLTGGDGLLVDRGRLLVVRGSTKDHSNGAIDVVKLRHHRTRGRVESEFSDPSFAGPSTIARAGKRLLVVNANFANATTATEFTVSAIARNAIRHGGHGGGRQGRG
jgi:sugar lactone lactonase YvrE